MSVILSLGGKSRRKNTSTGGVLPLEMEVVYPETLSARSSDFRITATILPAGAIQEVTYQTEGASLTVQEDGYIKVAGTGISQVTERSVRNPVLKKQLSIEVLNQPVRFTGSGAFRLTSAGGIRVI
jgi:hypothetical protein